MSRDILKIGSNGATVRELQTLLNTVGANIATDGDFGEDTFHTVCDFQEWKKLEPDGIVGPKTWYALDQAVLHHERRVAEINTDRLALAGRKAIERALAMWQSDVYDPRKDDYSAEGTLCKNIIDKFIRAPHALDWSWESPYSGDGDFQWCGAFAAYCWGPEIKQQIRQTYFSSTLRLDRYASYRSYNGEPNTGKGRMYVKLDENSTPDDVPDVRPGDILIIGPSRDPRLGASWHDYGNHICLVEDFSRDGHGGGVFRTLEGNGNGLGPHGEKQQGVVKGIRHVGGPGWVARRLIRPSEEDLA
jgi:hypothetical protein